MSVQVSMMNSTVFKLVVAGGREFNDYPLLKERLDFFLMDVDIKDIEIVSGKARGADFLGERYAEENGILIKEFPADWDTHGKRAGYIRNSEMASYGTHCVVFWDGVSKGSKMMIELAKRKGLVVRVVKY